MINISEQSLKGKGVSAAKSAVRKIAGKTLVKYSLVFVLVMNLPLILCFFFELPLYGFYIALQVLSCVTGIFHVWQMGKRFDWRNQDSLMSKTLLTLSIIMATMIVEGIVLWFCKPMHDFWLIFPTSALAFVVPLIFISTFDIVMAIPSPVYRKWRYPSNMSIPDPESIDFSNSYIVTFILRKYVRDAATTVMKFKAPADRITFGDLFYFYISEYNDRNRESPIQYLNDRQQPYDWQFYVKPNGWWQSRVYIDPSLTVRENKIKENNIIVSERV